MTTLTNTGATVSEDVTTSTVQARRRKATRDQAGFTLVEIAIVAGIIIIATILGIPAINSYVIGNKVSPLGQELQRFVARQKSASQGSGATPFAGMGAAQLANGLRGSSVVTITGSGADAVIQHGIGATDGVLTAAPATITTAGDAYNLTLTKVNEAACPSLAAIMQRVSEVITINTINVKTIGAGGAQGVYAAQNAEAACTAGDTNTFVFTSR